MRLRNAGMVVGLASLLCGAASIVGFVGCGGDSAGPSPGGNDGGGAATDGGGPIGLGPGVLSDGATGGDAGTSITKPLPSAAACTPGTNGSATVPAPTLLRALKDRYEEAWLGSAAVVDLDGDGKIEILVPRGDALIAWRADGTIAFKYVTGEARIWSSPVVGDFTGDGKLDVAVAARGKVFLLDGKGALLPGFPVTWEDEMRALSGGDVDGDGILDLVASVGRSGPTDVVKAWKGTGAVATGFPPFASGVAGCSDGKCYLAGCYDQNLAVADLDSDGKADVIAPHDNAYASFFRGTGVAFDANPMFPPKKTPGVRYLHALGEAQQGYSDTEATSLQAHFTNTAPALVDVDGDGKRDVIMLASVQNAAQTEREKGVGLWVLRPDASRITGWDTPFHASSYLSGLWDPGGNIVGITNQVAAADIDAGQAGPELVFAGFDGRIHAVAANKSELWSYVYTSDPTVMTGGVAIADLSGDGIPEIVFASYSSAQNKSHLFVLDAGGNELHKVALPRRGAMPVPTVADVDGNGSVEIVVSLKDALDKVESVLVFAVPGSQTNCLPWPTGRATLLRNGAP